MHLMGTDCFSFLFICLLFAFLRAGLNKIVFRIHKPVWLIGDAFIFAKETKL